MIITWIAGFNEVCVFFKRYSMPAWLTTLILIILSIICIIYIPILLYYGLCRLTLNYRRKIGTHRIECSFIRLLYYKCRNINKTMLYEIHKNLYHQCFSLKEKIRAKQFPNELSQKEAVANFVAYVQNSIEKIFGINLTINIKKLDADEQSNKILSPYIHCKGKQDNSSLFDRNFNYTYILMDDQSNDVKIYTQQAKEYNRNFGNSNYKVNSIFSYLLSKDENTCWMSNNLSIDSKNNLFYTSSENYLKHYYSMAVLKIIQPENKTAPKGIIVFDSCDPYKFSESECKYFMGLVAHLIYEIFEEIENTN